MKSALLFAGLSLALLGCSSDLGFGRQDGGVSFGDRDPDAPVIDALEAEPPQLQMGVGSERIFSVDAHDPQGRALSYTWDATGGTFLTVTTDRTVTWRAPGAGGRFEVAVRVRNDAGLDEIGRLTVTVISMDLPEVAFVEPTSGESVPGLGDLRVVVNASHPNGIDRVEFLLDGEQVHVDSAGPDFEWRWPVAEVSGTHELRARAFSPFLPDRPGIADAKVTVESVVVP